MSDLHHPPSTDTRTQAPIVIVGSGLAGYMFARELRKKDKNVPLLVVSRDHGAFYSKPMLSNALSKKQESAALIQKSAEAMASELNATILTSTTVAKVDPVRQTVHVHDPLGSKVLNYRDLVLAVGADPIQLTLGGDAADALHSVNDLTDFARYASKLDAATQVVILGAGLIGCEFANDLLSRGIAPVLVDPAPYPLSGLLPPEAGTVFRAKLEASGVEFRLERTAKRVERMLGKYRVTLDDASTLDGDVVLSAIGLRPRLVEARSAGIRTGRGVQTNRCLETSHPHIYALGDCAEVAGQVLPYVAPIMHQARALAATLTGARTEVEYPVMPITVKTPACPTVICPPASKDDTAWQVEQTADGMVATLLSKTAPTVPLGFALLGPAAVTRRQNLVAQLGTQPLSRPS